MNFARQKFLNAYNLNRHKKDIHLVVSDNRDIKRNTSAANIQQSSPETFLCQQCNKTFSTKSNLNKHEK